MTLFFQTYEQVGIKEDISDVISNISPTKTPFQTSIGNEKITNTLFQWQTDALRAVQSQCPSLKAPMRHVHHCRPDRDAEQPHRLRC